MTPWELKGLELVNCTCEYGCNCQFGALPDKGYCHAVGGFIIDEGHFGDTPLAGLRFAAAFKWPGPIHEGDGEAVAFIDRTADAPQREALLRILSGQDTEPFATMFAVFASTLSKFHDPVFTDVSVEIDVDARKGRVVVPDYLELNGRPIPNIVSGGVIRAQIVLPDGFEYEMAEIGSGVSRTRGPVEVNIQDKYAQFAHVHLNNKGVVRSRAAA